MSITREQYLEAKRIVEEYERAEWEEGMRDAEDLMDDDFEDEEDKHDLFEEEYTNCTCGAYVLSDSGKVCHVSDCYCGAG